MTATPGGKPEVRIGDWLKESWDILMANLGVFVLASLIYHLIMITCIGGLIFYGPLTCGFYLIVFDQMRGNKVELGRLFGAFEFFGDSFVPGLIFFILAIVSGALASSVIGVVIMLFLQTIFLFTFQLVADRRASGIASISKSFDKVKENFWQFFLFALVLVVIQAVGLLVIIGWLVTFPLIAIASAVAYRDIMGLSGSQGTKHPETI